LHSGSKEEVVAVVIDDDDDDDDDDDNDDVVLFEPGEGLPFASFLPEPITISVYTPAFLSFFLRRSSSSNIVRISESKILFSALFPNSSSFPNSMYFFCLCSAMRNNNHSWGKRDNRFISRYRFTHCRPYGNHSSYARFTASATLYPALKPQ